MKIKKKRGENKKKEDRDKKFAEQKPSNLLEGLVKKVLVEENLINPDDEMKVDGVNDYKDKSSRVDNLLAKNVNAPSASGAKGPMGKGKGKSKRKRQRQRKTEERCAIYPGRERPM